MDTVVSKLEFGSSDIVGIAVAQLGIILMLFNEILSFGLKKKKKIL